MALVDPEPTSPFPHVASREGAATGAGGELVERVGDVLRDPSTEPESGVGACHDSCVGQCGDRRVGRRRRHRESLLQITAGHDRRGGKDLNHAMRQRVGSQMGQAFPPFCTEGGHPLGELPCVVDGQEHASAPRRTIGSGSPRRYAPSASK